VPLRIAVATCRVLPEPDPDQELFLAALRDAGADAAMAAWDDERVDWGAFDLCVIRSTWNYYHALDAFLAWAARVTSVTRLCNSLEIVRWNAHKRYLRALADAGAAVVPTRWLDRASSPDALDEAARALGFPLVVKPAVSAASFGTLRLDDASALDAARAHVAALLGRPSIDEIMVQPYQRSVEGWGERSLIWIDGALSHAIRKSPRFGGQAEQVSGVSVPIADDERAVASEILRHVPSELLYARVDLARDAEGRPQLMELELLEPSLFLAQHPPALRALADATLRRARG
jgi:glutathione synthase/RimK-type ligase-like ATP-grasp enzyme